MTDYKLVPTGPTPEWVANLKRIRIGRMESVIEDVLAAAPAVQGEPVAWQLRTPEGRSEYRPPQLPAAWQPAEHRPCPEGIREGAPYDDPAFEALCREHEIWGTAAAALCAVFWEAGKRGVEQQPAPDVAALVEALERISKRASEVECRQTPCSPIQRLFVDIMQQADDALAAYRKQQEKSHDNQ